MIIIKILILILAALGAYHLYEDARWYVHKILHPKEIEKLLEVMEQTYKNKK